MLQELGVFLKAPPTLWCDNISATYLTANSVFHARTKHIEIDLHFVRDKVASGCLTVKFISSKDQVADVFTKPLVSTRFALLRDNLTVRVLPLRLRGPIEDIADHYSSKAKPILEESVTATSQPIEITTEDETSSLNTKQQPDKR